MRTRSHRKRHPSPGEDAQQLKGRAISTSWTTDEETELLNFFRDRKDLMISGATFTDHMFDQAAEYIEMFRRRGAVKTGKVCKSKWVRLKRTHRLITLLKSKCGTAFEWDDETGMGVTAERQVEWGNLIKGNKGFKAFANKGWPHCEAMQILMPASGIGQNAPQASGLIPSSFSSPNNHKRKSSLCDNTSISETSSSSRPNISEEAVLQIMMIGALTALTCVFQRLPALRYVAMPVPAPAPTHSPYQINAVQQLIASVEESAIVDGAKWLSEDNTIRITNIFQRDPNIAIVYLELRKVGDLCSRKFIMGWLDKMDAKVSS